jgi:hypothetical protein
MNMAIKWMMAASLIAASGAATAQVTYHYSGSHFATAEGLYTTRDSVQGSLTLSSPLAANLSQVTITPSAFSFSDGVGTIANSSVGVFNNYFKVSTNSAGQITAWDINILLFSPELVFEHEITTAHGPCQIPEPGCVFSDDAGVLPGGNVGFTDVPGSWTAPTPSALLAALFTEVTGVGPGKSLANKVELALTYFVASDIQATCAMITAFINEVEAQAGRKIVQALDAKLIAEAHTIEAAIGCDAPAH